MSISNTGSVDLESVLNVRRRTLTAIGETILPRQQHRYTDTIYLKREDHANSILSINSKILIFGELQLLCGIFERYTSNMVVYEESSVETSSSSPVSSNKQSFSATAEEDELNDEGLPIVSTLGHTSISPKGSVSPPRAGSPTRKKTMSAIGRSPTIGSTISEFSAKSLDGKRYGCIELPNMIIIEIIEIFVRNGMELVNVSSDYDKQSVLHQNFVFSKTRQVAHKYGLPFPRSTSFAGT
jgi:hypothetical protein